MIFNHHTYPCSDPCREALEEEIDLAQSRIIDLVNEQLFLNHHPQMETLPIQTDTGCMQDNSSRFDRLMAERAEVDLVSGCYRFRPDNFH